MPGPHTLSVKPGAQANPADVHLDGATSEVSANNSDLAPTPADASLTPPPRDVDRMLQRYGAQLPQYLDAHRQRVVAGSKQRWPLLRSRRAPGEKG